ncbi:MAG: hypothetical protein ABI867_11215 [Kofleriaceae bacterium]
MAFSPEVAARLAALECHGTFEAHLTVDAATPERRAAFADACARLGVACVLIELAAGDHRAQPMTSSRHHGALAGVLVEIEALHSALAAHGFAPVRVKLEADASNPGVPIDDPAAYFEYHARLALPPDADLEALRTLCLAAGAHLSHNERSAGSRFVTLRVRDPVRAPIAFAELVHILVAAGHTVASTKAEYTLHDDRLELDAGWLP